MRQHDDLRTSVSLKVYLMKERQAKGQIVYMAMEVAKKQGGAAQNDQEQGKICWRGRECLVSILTLTQMATTTVTLTHV